MSNFGRPKFFVTRTTPTTDANADTIIDTVNTHAPNFKASIIARQIHSPLDLERKFGLIGGDIMHGHMSLDQLWAARPMLGHGDYPGMVEGGMADSAIKVADNYPLGIGRPEDVASAAEYLFSDGATWITGQQMVVDGGYSAHANHL